MRILALVPGGISEQILFFPTLKTLKAKYPDALIDVIVAPFAKSAYRVCADVNEVLLFDAKDRYGLADYLNLLGMIRDREYDMAISLKDDWAISLLLWLNGIRVRVGYGAENSLFLTNPIQITPKQADSQQQYALLRGLGINQSLPSLSIDIPVDAKEWAKSQQERLNISEKGYILAYGDSVDTVDSEQKLIQDIQGKEPDVPIMLVQSLENQQWVQKIREKFPNLKVSQPLEIEKIAALIAGAKTLVSTDITATYLGTAVGTPVQS